MPSSNRRSIHAWETVTAAEPGPGTHNWEAEGYDPDESDEEPDPMADPDAAAREHMELLLELYLTSVISAKTFCLLCFWGAKGGLRGDAAVWGQKPNQSSRNYQRHLDLVLGFDVQRQEQYMIGVPAQPVGEGARKHMQLPFVPPHELLGQELSADPSLTLRTREAVEQGKLPPVYYSNPVVTGTSDLVVPLSLYIDAVPYTKLDSVIGVWLINVVSGVRHMVGLLRKRILCACGCRGWDSFYTILCFIRWSFTALAEGVHPAVRHDGRPWSADEQFRADRAGTSLRVRAMLLHTKGDWVEFCERFALPSHASGMRPCFCCSAVQEVLYNPIGVALDSAPWHTNSDADFDTAATTCEFPVVMSSSHHADLLGLLFYDQRKDGSHGRALRGDYPPLRLRAGDRLEPTPTMHDVGQGFDQLATFPAPAMFWRAARNSAVLHRCPLWDAALGITPNRVIAIDMLHCFYLGPLQIWATAAIWACIESEKWAGPRSTMYERHTDSAKGLQSELQAFYSAHHRRHPADVLSQVTSLTPKMLGVGATRRLKVRAMETWGVALFLQDLMRRHQHDPGFAQVEHFAELRIAGDLLMEFCNVLRGCPLVMLPAHQQRLLDILKRFLRHAGTLQLLTPKAHMLLHLVMRSGELGNPWSYHTFLDESLNKTLKAVVRLSHQANFERASMCKLKEVLSRPGVRRRLHQDCI